MELIRPTFEILTPIDGTDILRRIEASGRTCYKSEDRITDDSAPRFVRMVLRRGHESVLEHVSISVRIVCDRGVSHELVRHRLASFSQESTRYCDYGGQDMQFVIPPWLDIQPGVYRDEVLAWNNQCARPMWVYEMRRIELLYRDLRTLGWKPEQSRSILPNSLKTEVVMTCNIREWRHVFRLRTAKAAHPQMREIMIPMLSEFQRLIPVVFDDVEVSNG